MLCVTETFAIPAVPHLAGERKTFSEIFQKCCCPTVLHLTGNMGSFTYLEQCPCKKILVHACLSSGPAAATTLSPTSTALASTSHLKHSQYPQPQRSMQQQQNMLWEQGIMTGNKRLVGFQATSQSAAISEDISLVWGGRQPEAFMLPC